MDRASSHLIQQKNTEDGKLVLGLLAGSSRPVWLSGLHSTLPRPRVVAKVLEESNVQGIVGRDMGIAENAEVASREVSFRSGIPRAINREVLKHRQWMNLKNFVPLEILDACWQATLRKKTPAACSFMC